MLCVTKRSRYIAVMLRNGTHSSSVALGRHMGVFREFEIWPKLLCCVQYRIILHRDISRVYIISWGAWKPGAFQQTCHDTAEWKWTSTLVWDLLWCNGQYPILINTDLVQAHWRLSIGYVTMLAITTIREPRAVEYLQLVWRSGTWHHGSSNGWQWFDL